jgi:dTDP-4-amino-4,6-dideoxygalactose transaminase
MNPIKMVDLESQYQKIKQEIDQSLLNVVGHSHYINGPEVQLFAENLSHFLGVKHVIPCANGTDALQIALMALNLPKESEVLVPSFCYIAAAEAIALLGFKPIFIDSEPQYFNINCDKIEASINERTKAIIAVHLFGQCSDMLPILKIAQKYNLYVIEDNAQSIGSTYIFPDNSQKMAGTIGHIGTTSFFPSKNLGCMGDGGAIFTNDDSFAELMKVIANHGQKVRYFHERIGVNSRLDTLQAAILNVKIKHLNNYNLARQIAAERYNFHLKSIKEISVPEMFSKSSHVFHQYTIRVKNGKRNELKEYLEKLRIPCMIYYPVPVHKQLAFSDFNQSYLKFPNAELYCDEVLSLPMHTELTDEQITFVCDSIKEFFI